MSKETIYKYEVAIRLTANIIETFIVESKTKDENDIKFILDNEHLSCLCLGCWAFNKKDIIYVKFLE